jgi:tight adherence protein B
MAFAFLVVTFLAAFATSLVAVLIVRKAMDSDPAGSAADLGDDNSPLLLRSDSISTISPWRKLLEQFDLTERIGARIGEAGLNFTVGRLTLTMLFVTTVAFAICNEMPWLPFWAAAPASLLAGLCPYLYVLHKRTRRMLALEEQVPDALDSLARALRAGHPFTAALEHVSSQTPQPLGGEFRRTFVEGNLGAPWERALENLANRVPIMDVQVFVAAVQLQTRTGGNLGEILDKLSENMREAAAIRGEVRALSAQGRMAGRVLSLMPVFIAGIMIFVNPAFLSPLIHDEIGRNLMIAAALGLVASHFVIRKIVDIQL